MQWFTNLWKFFIWILYQCLWSQSEWWFVWSSTLDHSLYQQEVESQCLKMDFTQECTNSCQAALNTFKTALGCCVKYTSNINRALWSACGIPFPEFCPSTLCLSPPINQVIPQPDHQLLALIAPFQPHQSLVNHQVTLQLGHQLQPHLHPHQS